MSDINPLRIKKDGSSDDGDFQDGTTSDGALRADKKDQFNKLNYQYSVMRISLLPSLWEQGGIWTLTENVLQGLNPR